MSRTGGGVLDAEHAAFMQHGVSIVAASRDAAARPMLARAVGCRVTASRQRVRLLFPALTAGDLLADLQANGLIAVVVSKPATHRTIQLKGDDARLDRITRADLAAAGRYRESFVAALCELGHPRGLGEALMHVPGGTCFAVSFVPTCIFGQTPGPGAGEPMRAGA